MLSFGFSISLMRIGESTAEEEFLDVQKASGKHCIKKHLDWFN